MTDEVFAILQSAVNIARFEQVRRLTTLRERLMKKFPGKEQEINEALIFWANNARHPG